MDRPFRVCLGEALLSEDLIERRRHQNVPLLDP
jgi:hypothetical protein